MRFAIHLIVLLSLALGTAQAQVSEHLRINGYGSVEYEYNFSDRGRGDQFGSFDADGFDLVLNFTPADRFRIAADLNWEHGTTIEEGYGNIGYEYVFAEYAVADYLKIRAGKQFISFGIYNEIHTAKPVMLAVKEPSSTVRTDRVGSPVLFYPRWGTGLSFVGNYHVGSLPIDYIVQLTNGDHPYDNPHEKDYDKTKALNGRLRVAAYQSGLVDVNAGASYYFDDGDSLSLSSWGVQLEAQAGPFSAEFEYMAGSYTPYGAVAITRNGYYLQAGYLFADHYTPYARWEAHDPNTSKSEDLANTLVLGINARVNDYLFLKVEVDRFLSETKNSRLKGVNYTELKSSISFGF